MGTVLATQHEVMSSDLQHPHNRWVWCCLCLALEGRRQGQLDPRSSLASQPSRKRILHVQGEILSKKIRWGMTEEDTQHRPLASMHAHAGDHTHNTQADTQKRQLLRASEYLELQHN